MQKYLEFLLEHYRELNMPYSFPVTFSYIASPAFMEQEAILCYSGEYDVIGAIGYIIGTGEQDYQDTYVAQIQIAFFLEPYRGTLLFVRAMQFLTQHIAQIPHEVKELRFWAPADDQLRSLFAKLAERTTTVETENGILEEYRAPFSAWHSLAARFRHDVYYN